MSRSKLTVDPNITVPIVLRLSVLKHLTTLAEERGVSRSALVREALILMAPRSVVSDSASSTEIAR